MRGILVTGATGTFGRAFLQAALAHDRGDERVVAFSRDEAKQAVLREEFAGHESLRLFLGDVRDPQRLEEALAGIDTVVHAAALKRVDAGSYNPSEMVKTNVLGTENVIKAAIRRGVRRVVVISSDKAVNPTNIYGASKYMAECCAIQGNVHGAPNTLISCVRYGNVLGSRGSVVGIWREQFKNGQPITLTDPRMTRFVMTIEQAVQLVLFALRVMEGGEVFLPKLPCATVEDIARAVIGVKEKESFPHTYIGVRPGGEKFAESLLNEEEPVRTYIHPSGAYIITPSRHDWTAKTPWSHLDKVSPGFAYRSDLGTHGWISVEELRKLIDSTGACK